MSGLLYDLCCGGGGVARAALSLGWRVIGVDITPQPDYPSEFILADALQRPLKPGADLVWCSPDCQGYSRICYFRPETAKPRLVNELREVCKSLSKHYVIENVQPCPDLISPIRLCGFMFDLPLIRHRLFETSFFVPQPRHIRHRKRFFEVAGHNRGSLAEWQEAMGLYGMSKSGLRQAVPFAYTWYILSNFTNTVRR